VHYLNLAFATLATLSSILLLWQWLAARRFPLHRKDDAAPFAPGVSILKALKGRDETTAASLQSWFKQDYSGPVEIIFGVADPNDPVCEIVRRLMAEHPKIPARLIVCENLDGANAKVAKLARLEKLAAHDLILICDADVRVQADFLAHFVLPLRDETTALVNCFYRLANPVTVAMRWEAIAVNADFWSQVLQSKSLKPLDFALGAAILIRRSALHEIGGFASLVNCLADDFQLGHRIARNRHHIALGTTVVECWDTPQNWTHVWKHQLRWARTVRVCQPLPYFFSILSNAGFWAVVWLVFSAVSGGSRCLLIIASFLLLLRMMIANDLQRWFTQGQKLVSPFWLVPVKDLLQAAIWLAAFLGNKVEWRGRKMQVRRDGTLVDL
jgi:ceramide glucosyltransferase